MMLHRRGVGLKFLICVEITSKRQFVVVKEIIESRCLPDHIFGNVKSENNFLWLGNTGQEIPQQ